MLNLPFAMLLAGLVIKRIRKKQECTLGLLREQCGVESVVVARQKMFKKPLLQVEQWVL